MRTRTKLAVLATVLTPLFGACGSEDTPSSPGPATGFDAGSGTDAATDGAVAPADAATTNDGASDASDASTDTGSDADADAAPISGALQLNGASSYLHLPAAAGGASETAFTAEVWFKTTTLVGSMFEVYGVAGADRFISLNSGKVCFYVYNPVAANPQVCTTAATYADGAWHHAAGTLGANGVNLYVDGAPAATSNATTESTFVDDTAFRAGMGYTGFSSSIVFFNGELDEIRVWSTERTAAEIAATYKMSISPSTTGLQGYWKLDETGTTPTAKDETTPAHNGDLVGFTFAPSPWVGPGAF